MGRQAITNKGLFDHLFKFTFSHFKQNYTNFYTLFHLHVFQKTLKNFKQQFSNSLTK